MLRNYFGGTANSNSAPSNNFERLRENLALAGDSCILAFLLLGPVLHAHTHTFSPPTSRFQPPFPQTHPPTHLRPNPHPSNLIVHLLSAPSSSLHSTSRHCPSLHFTSLYNKASEFQASKQTWWTFNGHERSVTKQLTSTLPSLTWHLVLYCVTWYCCCCRSLSIMSAVTAPSNVTITLTNLS